MTRTDGAVATGAPTTGRSGIVKVVVGSVAAVVWGLFFDDLARSGRWLFDTSYVNKYSLADLHSRYVDAHLIWIHARNLYGYKRGAFTYPPLAAYMFWPFHLIGFRATMTVWTIASVAALAAVFAISLRRWLGVGTADAWLASAAGLAPAAVFLFYPLRSLLVWGQMGVLLMALVFVDLFVMPKRYRGVLIGAATAVKLLPGLFVVWLLARRDVAATVRLVVTFAVLTVAAALVYLHASTQYWLHVLPSGRDVLLASNPTNQFGPLAHWLYGVGKLPNQSLRGMLGRPPFLWPGTFPWAVLAIGVLAVGFAATVRLVQRDRELAAFCTLMVVTVLVSPVSWLHYWSFVALAPLLAIIEWRRDRAMAIAAIVLAVATCADLENTSNLLFAPFTQMAPITVFIVRNLYVLGGLAFLVVASVSALRAERTDALASLAA